MDFSLSFYQFAVSFNLSKDMMALGMFLFTVLMFVKMIIDDMNRKADK